MRSLNPFVALSIAPTPDCNAMRTPFYSERDPLCREREPDDKRFGLDHFFNKLLRIPDGLHTASARRLAGPRVAFKRANL